MNIKLNDNYRIECDKLNYTVIKTSKHKEFLNKKDKEAGKVNPKHGKITENVYGYYSRLDSLVKGIIDDKIKTSEIDKLLDLKLLVNDFGLEVEINLGDELKRVMKENEELKKENDRLRERV